jgi:hypothetical protein
VKSILQNVKADYQYAYCKVTTPELLELWAEVSGFLDYQLHVEGVVLYF